MYNQQISPGSRMGKWHPNVLSAYVTLKWIWQVILICANQEYHPEAQHIGMLSVNITRRHNGRVTPRCVISKWHQKVKWASETRKCYQQMTPESKMGEWNSDVKWERVKLTWEIKEVLWDSKKHSPKNRFILEQPTMPDSIDSSIIVCVFVFLSVCVCPSVLSH